MGLIARGLAAGAAGTTALNAVTYLDMAIRGRGTSGSPQQLIENAADAAGVDVPGSKSERQNRVDGLGPLAGSAVGVLVGAATGLVDRVTLRKLPVPVLAVFAGAAAMVLTDVPLELLDVSDPRDWAATDWVSDAVPHLAYGLVTVATLRAGQR